MFLCRVYIIKFLPFIDNSPGSYLGGGYLKANKLVSYQKHAATNSTVAFSKLGFFTLVAPSSKKL